MIKMAVDSDASEDMSFTWEYTVSGNFSRVVCMRQNLAVTDNREHPQFEISSG